MNFDFSDEQKELRDHARKFLSEQCPPSEARSVLTGEAPRYSERIWQEMGSLGWLGVAVAPEDGGLGLGHLALCVLAEELGRSLAPVPFASSLYFFAEALRLFGSEQQRSKYLPAICAGTVIGCLFDTRPVGTGTTAFDSAKVVAGKLSGQFVPIVDGNVADVAIVPANADGRPGLYLVDLRASGVQREPIATIDPSRDFARVTFAEAACEKLGNQPDGLAALDQLRHRGAVLLAFEQVGIADRCLEMARDYALVRFAFGRPIGSYQAVKHRLVDMYVKNELARSNAYYGAWALSQSAAELPLAAAAARIAASDAAWFATKESIQLHGGLGFTWEADCHLYYRRSRQLAVQLGSDRHWKELLIDQLEQRNEAG